MMDLFKQFATDESLETSGVWVDYGSARFLIARMGNRNYVKKLSALAERNQKLLDAKDEAADALNEKLMVEVLADTILLNWEGVSYQGADLAYTSDNAKMVLAMKDFRREIVKMSDDMEAYKSKQEEALGKP